MSDRRAWGALCAGARRENTRAPVRASANDGARADRSAQGEAPRADRAEHTPRPPRGRRSPSFCDAEGTSSEHERYALAPRAGCCRAPRPPRVRAVCPSSGRRRRGRGRRSELHAEDTARRVRVVIEDGGPRQPACVRAPCARAPCPLPMTRGMVTLHRSRGGDRPQRSAGRGPTGAPRCADRRVSAHRGAPFVVALCSSGRSLLVCRGNVRSGGRSPPRRSFGTTSTITDVSCVAGPSEAPVGG